MWIKSFLQVLIFVGVVIGLEYLIRHACAPADENRWKWDRWDTLTAFIALDVGFLLAVIMQRRTKVFVPLMQSQGNSVEYMIVSNSSPETSSFSWSQGYNQSSSDKMGTPYVSLSDPSQIYMSSVPNVVLVPTQVSSTTSSFATLDPPTDSIGLSIGS
jgi:hypothetical protein